MKIAFLGYGPEETGLHEVLRARGHDVAHRSNRVDDLSAHDRVVSFGYRHILSQAVLETARAPVANLHVSHLPHNRGAHPNFWSWVEDTPKGVTIHEMTRGLDTGPILAQRRLDPVGSDHTLRSSQALLIAEIEALFEQVADDWLAGAITPRPQVGTGSYHAARDLPEWVTDWDMPVMDAIERYRNG